MRVSGRLLAGLVVVGLSLLFGDSSSAQFGVERVVFGSADFGEGTALYSVGPDGSDLRRLTSSVGWVGDPEWSPDGSRIAFSSDGLGEGRDVFVMDADGSDVQALVTGPGDQRQPSWSPDGSWLAFVSDERYVGDLVRTENVFLVKVDTGQRVLVGDHVVGRGGPVWSPDSSRVFFSARCIECDGGGDNIVSVSVDGRERVALTASVGSDRDPVVTPDGARILFVREEIGDEVPVEGLWSVRLDGSGEQLIRADLFGGSRPSVSPDGRFVVLENFVCLPRLVCVIDAFSGELAVERLPFIAGTVGDGMVLNMTSPDWGCCSDPGRGEPIPRRRVVGSEESSVGVVSGDRSGAVGAGFARVGLAVTAKVSMAELWGGGFQNMLAFDGSDLLMAGDNSGVHRMTGTTWRPSSSGFSKFQQSREVASFAVDLTEPDVVYAATTGGLYRSEDGGDSWELKKESFTEPKFKGNNRGASSEPLFATHPRATGRLLIADNGTLYAASAEDGLYRNTTSGAGAWTQIALDDHRLRSLVLHPSNGKMYLASVGIDASNRGGGIWEIDCSSDPCGTPVILTGAEDPDQPEELVFDDADRLWCACGSMGVWRAAGGAYTSWVDRSSNPNNAGAPKLSSCVAGPCEIWNSITIGDFNGTGLADVVAGAVIDGNGASTATVRWTSTGASFWYDVDPNAAGVENANVCDAGNKYWWMADPENTVTRRNLISHEAWDTGFVEFGPDGSLYITGRSGVWRLSDLDGNGKLGTGSNSANYDVPCPMVKGLASTANRAIDVGPTGEYVVIGNTDYDALSSALGLKARFAANSPTGIIMQSISEPPATNGPTVGFDVDYNNLGDFTVIAAGRRSNYLGLGGAYEADATNVIAHNTTTLGLDSGDPNAIRVHGIATATSPEGVEYVLAAVPDRGLWRSVNGAWLEADVDISGTPILAGSQPEFTRIAIEWVRNDSGTEYVKWVYLLDRETGIWRSNDWGAPGSWTKFWDGGGALSTHFPPGNDYVGFLTVDPNNRDSVFFTSAEGLFQISNARMCAVMCTASETGAGEIAAKLGPVGFTPNGDYLIVSSRVEDAADPAELWVSDNDGAAGTWAAEVPSDDAIFKSVAFALTDIAIHEDGNVFLSSRGQGIIKIEPEGAWTGS